MYAIGPQRLQFTHLGTIRRTRAFIVTQTAQWENLFGKETRFLSCNRSTMRFGCKGFSLIASNSPSIRDHLRAVELRNDLITIAVRPGLGTGKRRWKALILHDGIGSAKRYGGHVLHPASDNQVRSSRHHCLRCIVDGLLT